METTLIPISAMSHDHMPFGFKHCGVWNLAFCRSEPRCRVCAGNIVKARQGPWKLYWSYPRIPAMGRIHTGLAEHDTECSPSACLVDGEVQLSFIGCFVSKGPLCDRVTRNGFSHQLFRMRGPRLDQLGAAEPVCDEECYCGFCRPDLTLVCGGTDGVASFWGTSEGKLVTTFDRLTRISYCFDQPSRFLITGELGVEEPITVLYDFDQDRVLGQLEIDGTRLYKPTLCEGLIAFPFTLDRELNRSQIRYANSFEIAPTTIEVTKQ